MSIIQLSTYKDYISNGTSVADSNDRVQYIADYVEDYIAGKQCKLLCNTPTKIFNGVLTSDTLLYANPFIAGDVTEVKIDGEVVSGFINSLGFIFFNPVITIQQGEIKTIEITQTQNASLLTQTFITACLETAAYIWRLGEKQTIQLTQSEYLGGLKISLDKYIASLIKNETKLIMI